MSSSRKEWEETRRTSPELRLISIGPDDLSWLIAGRPEASASRECFDRVCLSMSEERFRDAANQLLEFFRQHSSTFQCSGWVDGALGAICLNDKQAALKFLKPYWLQIRKPLPKSTMVAFEALSLVDGGHRRHWLAAIRWIQAFYWQAARYYSGKTDSRFVSEALHNYLKRPAGRNHACLTDQSLKAIAKAVVSRPNAPSTALCDNALAILFPDTSASTIAHLRAKAKKQFPSRR